MKEINDYHCPPYDKTGEEGPLDHYLIYKKDGNQLNLIGITESVNASFGIPVELTNSNSA